MRTILEWFKPGARVKRYIILQIISIGLLIFSIITLKSIYDLNLNMLISYIALITLSAFGIIFSFILAQKNILLVSLRNISKKNKNVRVRKLLYGDPSLKKGAKVVVIGGGSGLPNLLKGLKEFTENITAIVNVSEDDSSLSTAMTCKEDITPGDIRKCIAALSISESEVAKLLVAKPEELDEKSKTVGNLIISSLINITGSFAKAIEKLPEVFKMQGRILPVTTDEIVLCAGLENGEVVVGKQNVCDITREQKSSIKQIFLKEGNVKALPEVIDAIKTANVIVIGPGSLYTSVISNFLVEDVSKAIIKSRAKKVYISNLMNQPGQTDGYTLARYLNEVERYIGKHVIDYAIANNGEITVEMIKDFNQIESTPVRIDLENIQNRTISVVKEDLILTAPGAIIHDSDRLAEIIMSIAKSKRIGDLNIVRIKKKHMKNERRINNMNFVKSVIQKFLSSRKSSAKTNIKKKVTKTTDEIKVREKTNATVDKIQKAIKKG